MVESVDLSYFAGSDGGRRNINRLLLPIFMGIITHSYYRGSEPQPCSTLDAWILVETANQISMDVENWLKNLCLALDHLQ